MKTEIKKHTPEGLENKLSTRKQSNNNNNKKHKEMEKDRRGGLKHKELNNK